MQIFLKILLRVILPGFILIIWYFLNKYEVYPEIMLPAPQNVLIAFWELSLNGDIFYHIMNSFQRFLIGYLIGVGLAIPIGLAIGWYRTLDKYTETTITFLRQLPGIAWIPLALLWFGIGNLSSYFIVGMNAFFSPLINSISGVKDVDKNLVDAARILGVKNNSWLMFKEVIFPSAVPHIMTGMRIALTYAWGGIVAAEMLAASNGLGWMIEANRRFHFPERVILAMILIGLCGFLIDDLLRRLEKYLNRWKSSFSE
tara:strand:- start:902 stop:1672 length:771 start_codon:yes stop_codon:yes gene_type:complete